MNYVIWSEEHQAWWRVTRHGYTRSLAQAGRFSKEEAEEIVTEANHFLPAGTFNEVAIPDPLQQMEGDLKLTSRK